ncbi:MAG: hypothetical protein ABSH39_19445 [Candidatus Acidiferrum sp.]|jgi:hypothetical protein
MHESKLNHRQQVAVDGEHVHHDPGPYWKRAHHDWRFWIGMFLMLMAITVYFMSDDLSLVPSSHPGTPASTAVKR